MRIGLVARAVLLLAGTLAAGAPSAVAASGWAAKGRGSGLHVEGRSRSPGGLLWLSCADGVKLYLYPPRGWDGTKLDPTYVTIDEERITMSVDGTDDGVVLSDLPNDAVGITGSLLARIKRGRVLVISGAATTTIPPARLTFPLEGAASAIATFERSCPAARRL